MTEPEDPGGGDPAPENAAAPAAAEGPLVAHRALATPATVDRGARTVEVVWSTGARARNIVGGLGVITEELEMTPAAVRMDALRSGRAPVLDTHRRGGARDVLGRVVAARLEAGRGYATLQFSSAADVEPVWQRIADGTLRSVSVGYRVHRYEQAASTALRLLGPVIGALSAGGLVALADVTPTDRAVTLAANRGLGWMLDTTQAKEFALVHWLTSGASGGRLFVRVFDGAGNVREDIAGDVLASITTMQWNGPAKGWNAGAPMDDANFNRRQTIRVGASVAYAQVGVIGFDGSIDLQSLRLYGLPEAAPAVLNGTPLLTGALFGSGRREFAAEVSWDLPSLAPGATSLLDVTVNGARAGDLAQASLVSSTRFIELDAAVWSNNTVRVMARNISAATFDLAAATLSVEVVKRRVP